MAKVARLGVGPLVPDSYTTLLQPTGIGIALQEPEQFVDDAFKMNFLSGEQGESLLEIETHLMAKDADSTSTGTVALLITFVKDALQ